MATPSTYAELQTTIADWLNRQTLTSQIPTFIAGAEDDINRALRDRRMIVTREATADCGSVALPGDWLEALRVMIDGASSALAFATLDSAPVIAAAGGTSSHYTLRGMVLDVLPPPADAAQVIEMTYYASIPRLSDGAPTNWLLSADPMLYLYGSCMHAAPYLVDDERVPVWATSFTRRIEALNAASFTSRHSGAPLVRKRRGF